jgi:hypothetical protein
MIIQTKILILKIIELVFKKPFKNINQNYQTQEEKKPEGLSLSMQYRASSDVNQKKASLQNIIINITSRLKYLS